MSNVQLTANAADTGIDDGVVVRIPADPRHLRIVRMVAATFASDSGYSIDDVDDVRMAADEICAAVLEQNIASPVTVTFRCEDGRLTMWAEAAMAGSAALLATPAMDELRSAILGAVADSFSTSTANGRVTATFTKVGAAST